MGALAVPGGEDQVVPRAVDDTGSAGVRLWPASRVENPNGLDPGKMLTGVTARLDARLDGRTSPSRRASHRFGKAAGRIGCRRHTVTRPEPHGVLGRPVRIPARISGPYRPGRRRRHRPMAQGALSTLVRRAASALVVARRIPGRCRDRRGNASRLTRNGRRRGGHAGVDGQQEAAQHGSDRTQRA